MESGLIGFKIVNNIRAALSEIEGLSTDEKVSLLNDIKLMLHENSPMKSEPVDCVLWRKSDVVVANDYNPNSVAPPEMRLLELSILEDGYTQPVVTMETESGNEVVDGFHRTRVGKESKEVRNRVHGYIPVVSINASRQDKGDRIAATIRHNRARGKHRVDAMSDIVVDLRKRNWSEEKIGKQLGMEPDEVLRLCQISGLAEMFKDRDFSKAWEADDCIIAENESISTSGECETATE